MQRVNKEEGNKYLGILDAGIEMRESGGPFTSKAPCDADELENVMCHIASNISKQ